MILSNSGYKNPILKIFCVTRSISKPIADIQVIVSSRMLILDLSAFENGGSNVLKMYGGN